MAVKNTLIPKNYRNSNIQVEISFFRNDIENLIEWQQGHDFWWKPQNVGKAKIAGLESGVKINLPNNMAYLNIFYTKMRATDETPGSATKGNRLIYRPDNKLDISTGLKLFGIKLNLNYRIVSKSFVTSDNSKQLPKYELLNGNLGYDFSFINLFRNLWA